MHEPADGETLGSVAPDGEEQKVQDLRYYFVWPTRRRRPFLDGEILERTAELLSEAAYAMGADVTSVSSGGDYLIVTVEALPDLSPLTIVSHLKRHSAGRLRREFPELARLPSIWTRQFLATSRDDLPSERIRAFIERQPRSGGRRYPRPGSLRTEQEGSTAVPDVEIRHLPPLD